MSNKSKDKSTAEDTTPVEDSPSGPASKTSADEAADIRNSTGGQSPEGSKVEADKEFVSTDELAKSDQPKAPSHPLEVPKQKLSDAFDTAEPAAAGE